MPAIKSNANGNWATGSTWVGGVAPVAGDVVTIAAGHAVSIPLSTTAECGTKGLATGVVALTIESTATLNVVGTLLCNNDLFLSPGGILNRVGAIVFDNYSRLYDQALEKRKHCCHCCW